MLRHWIDTLGGLWELAKLGLRGANRSDHPYWSWRQETAFGSDPARWPPRHERRRALLEYGRWVCRMKRMG